MLTAAAVRTAIDLHCLGAAVLFFTFRPDMAQFPSVMADVIVFILKNGVCPVVILSNVVFVCPCLPLLMVLKLDETADSILFQIQQALLTAVAAVGSHCLQGIPKCIPMFFQNRKQRIIVRSLLIYLLYCDLDVIGRL